MPNYWFCNKNFSVYYQRLRWSFITPLIAMHMIHAWPFLQVFFLLLSIVFCFFGFKFLTSNLCIEVCQ